MIPYSDLQLTCNHRRLTSDIGRRIFLSVRLPPPFPLSACDSETRTLTSSNNRTKPTVGFKDTKISYGNVTITCWDISGQENYRPHWNRYCAGQDVIMSVSTSHFSQLSTHHHHHQLTHPSSFVIDSSTPSALEKGRQELCNLIFQDDLRDTPVLILVNKADLTAGQYTENIQRESSTVMVPKEINEALRLDTEIIRQQPDRKVACFHVSAKTGSNFRAVELWLVALATNMN